MTTPTMPNELPEGDLTVKFTGTELPLAVLDELAAANVPFNADERIRFEHGRDWWPLTIGWISKGVVPALAGVVVLPQTIQHVSDNR
jgi:hypothetical protein